MYPPLSCHKASAVMVLSKELMLSESDAIAAALVASPKSTYPLEVRSFDMVSGDNLCTFP